MTKVSIDEISNAIAEELKEYSQNILDAVGEAADDTSTKILKDVKANAKHFGWSDDYVNGFAKNNQSTPNNRCYVVWNKKYYWLVHLLEKGHALKNGGRSNEFPHMFPAERANIPEFEKVVERIIKGGG